MFPVPMLSSVVSLIRSPKVQTFWLILKKTINTLFMAGKDGKTLF
jgi:hypothetical protein